MNITLDSNPSDAPGCLKLVASDGRDMLVQTDWDWPGIASTFGWITRDVQKCDKCGEVSFGLHNQVVKYCRPCKCNVGSVCYHSGTDGTVDCPNCGVTASQFIKAAREWIDEHDGAEAEDPGYFS